jgi:hypothetical protein
MLFTPRKHNARAMRLNESEVLRRHLPGVRRFRRGCRFGRLSKRQRLEHEIANRQSGPFYGSPGARTGLEALDRPIYWISPGFPAGRQCRPGKRVQVSLRLFPLREILLGQPEIDGDGKRLLCLGRRRIEDQR